MNSTIDSNQRIHCDDVCAIWIVIMLFVWIIGICLFYCRKSTNRISSQENSQGSK